MTDQEKDGYRSLAQDELDDLPYFAVEHQAPVEAVDGGAMVQISGALLDQYPSTIERRFWIRILATPMDYAPDGH